MHNQPKMCTFSESDTDIRILNEILLEIRHGNIQTPRKPCNHAASQFLMICCVNQLDQLKLG